MSAYLQSLAPRLDQIITERRHRIIELRAEMGKVRGLHPRTPRILAELLFGAEIFARIGVEYEAFTQAEGQQLLEVVRDGLIESAKLQQNYQAVTNDALRFVELMREGLSSGQVYCTNEKDDMPKNCESWGWQKRRVLGDCDLIDHRPSADKIGWIEGDSLYIHDQVALKNVQSIAKEGSGITCTPETLRKRLHDEGLLVSTDKRRGKLHIRKTFMGVRQRVLHFKASTFVELDPKSTGSAAEDGDIV